MDDLDITYRKDPNIVFRDIEGQAILVPIRRSAANLDSIFTLNETATRIWELIDGEHTLSEIRDALVREYDVAPEEAEVDVTELVGQLKEIEAVEQA